MAKRKINSCGCNLFVPFGYSTNFLGITLWYTVICVNCHKKARARTLEKAIDKWNTKMDKGGEQPPTDKSNLGGKQNGSSTD